MHRRTFLTALLAAGTLSGCRRYWPHQGLWNPCLDTAIPPDLANHELVQAAWQGIDPSQVWDCHTHLLGFGDTDSGVYLNPELRSWWHPVQRSQFAFYINAACVERSEKVDLGFVARLQHLAGQLPAGMRLMLLAFDYHRDDNGKPIKADSPFYTPNAYAARIAKSNPQRFEWIASVHPYREDCDEALQQAAADGARAVKWLPQAMNIDPASPRCDRFYQVMARLDIPLLSHAGKELAVESEAGQDFGNPLRLRRALDNGVRVIVAHCATQGDSEDLDSKDKASVRSFDLFARLMNDSNYNGRVFGDISAITQMNRLNQGVGELLRNQHWHHRLVHGSDYPLPGVFPLFLKNQLVQDGFIDEKSAEVIFRLREYNPLLFDFVLKRHMKSAGMGLLPVAFHSRRVFV